MENHDKKVHSVTSTTIKVDAGYKKYHCGFFCQRKTIADEVIDPKVLSTAPPTPQVLHA